MIKNGSFIFNNRMAGLYLLLGKVILSKYNPDIFLLVSFICASLYCLFGVPYLNFAGQCVWECICVESSTETSNTAAGQSVD